MELNLHYEARGEGVHGMVAVAHVTLNRTKSGKFPKSICEVVKQPKQFSWVAQFPNYHSTKVDETAKKLAYDIMINNRYSDNTEGALFFHAVSVPDFRRKFIKQIGSHKFYK